MVRSGIRSYFGVIKEQFKGSPTSWLAFAALLAWMFGLYWSNLFVGRSSTELFDFIQLRALWLAVEAVVLLALYAVARVVFARMVPFAAIAGTCLFLGTVLVLFAPAGVDADGLRIGGVLLTGVGSALFLAFSGVGFARKGPKALLVNVALALLVASVFDSILLFVPDGLRSMMVALLPVIGMVLLIVSLGRTEPVEKRASATRDPSKHFNLIRIIALPLVVGLAYGLMQRLTGDTYAADATGVNVATIVSFFLSAVFIAFAALFFDSRKLIKLVCFVAIPIIGIAFVMLPLYADAEEAAQAICVIGFNSFYFMVWALWAGDRNDAALPKRFVLGLFVLVGAESLGSVLGIKVVSAVRDSGATLAVVSLVVVYLLLMAAIFSFDRAGKGMRASDRAEQGAASAAAGEKRGERAFAALSDVSGEGTFGSTTVALEAWAERYQLSARETEVFELLARGRNRVYISKTLFISDNTTRTHMKNVYRKLGVHSQQELIDLLEHESGVE